MKLWILLVLRTPFVVTTRRGFTLRCRVSTHASLVKRFTGTFPTQYSTPRRFLLLTRYHRRLCLKLTLYRRTTCLSVKRCLFCWLCLGLRRNLRFTFGSSSCLLTMLSSRLTRFENRMNGLLCRATTLLNRVFRPSRWLVFIISLCLARNVARRLLSVSRKKLN